MKLSTICEDKQFNHWLYPDMIYGYRYEGSSIAFIYTEETGLLTGSDTHLNILYDLENAGDSQYSGWLVKLLQEKYHSEYLKISVNGRSCPINHLYDAWEIGSNPRPDLSTNMFFDILPDDQFEKAKNGEDAGYLVSLWKTNKFVPKCMDELYKQNIISDPVYISTPEHYTKLWRNRSMISLDRANIVSPKQSGTGLFPGQKWWAMQSEGKNHTSNPSKTKQHY